GHRQSPGHGRTGLKKRDERTWRRRVHALHSALPRGYPGNEFPNTRRFSKPSTLEQHRTHMAKKKATKKAAPKKAAAAKPAAPKPIKEALGKSGLVSYISEATGVVSRDVRAVLASLENAVHGSVSKKGVGSFTLPGLLKITAVNVPAKRKRKGINPSTKEEQWFAAKPASVKVKVRP